MTPVFITGFLRSGTTLLEKTLHNHPQCAIAPQPFPYLFYNVKKAFYHHINVAIPHYPLGHLFREKNYSRSQFLKFVLHHRMQTNEVDSIMQQMRGYSGQMMPELIDKPAPEGTLSEIFQNYSAQFPGLFGKPGVRFAGSKEVFCEEFIPCFLHEGFAVILIIRDPRDIVASIHGGRGTNYANAGLTVLQILRSWRKSVAYAIQYSDQSGFHCLFYEQLVKSPSLVLQALAQKLGIDPFPDVVVQGKLTSQNGEAWQGNSSFHQPATGAPRYHQILDSETIGFIDTICHPEMNFLNIPHKPYSLERALHNFRDPFQSGQPSLTEKDSRMEKKRLSMILEKSPGSLSSSEAESWFIFSSIRSTLHQSTTRGTCTNG